MVHCKFFPRYLFLSLLHDTLLFSDAMIEDIISQEHYENTVDEVRGERIMIVMFYANW